MDQFPLYNTLNRDLPDKDLTVKQKNQFVKNIQNIDTATAELVYVLIKCHYIQNDDGDTLSIPYEGQFKDESVQFDFKKFPKNLRLILYKFLELHMKKIKEDSLRNSVM